MSFKVPRGTQDILPGQSENGKRLKRLFVIFVVFIAITKFAHQFSSKRIYLHVGLGKQLMLYKRKCIHLKIVEGVH